MTIDLPPAAPLPGEAARAGASPDHRSHAELAMVNALIRLDAAAADHARARRPVVLRIGRGVATHFKLRVAEWFATALLLQFGLILYGPTDVFPGAPGFRVMAQWASEETWGLICLAVGGAHLAALTINGTFRGFRWSPHIRAGASLLACFLWLQITLGIWLSGAAATGVGTYRLVLALELWNFVRACLDTGLVEGRRASDGR